MAEENKRYKRQKRAYKKQGIVQVPRILGDQVIVTFVGNFLVGGPKICDWIGPDFLRPPACNCFLEPVVKRADSDQTRLLGNTGKD